MVYRIATPASRDGLEAPTRPLPAMHSGIALRHSMTTSSGTVPIPRILMPSMAWQARAAMLPGESSRSSWIGGTATSTGRSIARCRIGESLRGHASMPGLRSCDRALRSSGRNDAPSVAVLALAVVLASAAVAFTSATVVGVGSEPQNNYQAIASRFLENNSGN
jgi:hypothetical protein